ncbi:MAG TPA: BON domain-containing protein [Thermoanaerobaculia bacterium]
MTPRFSVTVAKFGHPTIREGVVMLSGSVENRMTKRRVEDVAESVSGVRRAGA